MKRGAMWLPVVLVLSMRAPPAAIAADIHRTPDLSIARASSYDFVGEGIVNAHGNRQSIDIEVPPGKTREVIVKIDNPWSRDHTFVVTGSAPGPLFDVSYADRVEDVTSAVTGGTYQATLRAGRHAYLYIDVTASEDALTGDARSIWVRAQNVNDADLVDVVRAHVTVPPLRVWAVNYRGTLRCTAIFPDRTLSPGFTTQVSFTLTNLTDHNLHPYSYGYLVFEDEDGDPYWDTRPKYEGPSPGLGTLSAGETADLYAFDTRVRWSGPLTIAPACSGLHLDFPKIKLDVAQPGAPASVSDSIDAAVNVPGSPFQVCHPGPNGESATGSFETPDGQALPPLTLRCWAEVRREDGFDVVALNLVSPMDGDDYTIPEDVPLFGIPDLPGTGPFVAARWSFVVTTSYTRPYISLMFSRAPDTDGASSAFYELHDGEWTNSGGGGCGYLSAAASYNGEYFILDWPSACTGTLIPEPSQERVVVVDAPGRFLEYEPSS